MDFSITFIKIFFLGVYLILPVIAMLSMVIALLGLIVGRIESWKKPESLYWAFITALTVGYGDVIPKNKVSRCFSIIIATLGIMLAGVLVAVTVEATSHAFKSHISQEDIRKIQNKIDMK